MARILKFGLLISFIMAILIHGASAKSIDQGENFYLVYIRQKDIDCVSNEYRTMINEIIDNIHDLIVSHKDSYQDPSNLELIENETKKYKKGRSPYIIETSCIPGSSVLYTYLTYDLADQVRNIKNVHGCEPNRKMPINPFGDEMDDEDIQWTPVFED